MITAIASAVHGNDALTKGAVISAHAAAYGILGYIAVGWLGLIFPALAILWWFTLRTGKQAKIELKKMDTINPPHPSYMDVLKAHYYTGILTVIGLYFFNYEKRPNLINNGKFWDCRRPTEFLTGLTLDIVLAALLFILL